MSQRNVVIIGSGPAGLTAALYTARANLQPLLIEGLEAGGQLMMTTLVENWPGRKDGVMGPDLMTEMRAQAEKFGAEIIQSHVTSVDLCTRPFVVKTADATLHVAAWSYYEDFPADLNSVSRNSSWGGHFNDRLQVPLGAQAKTPAVVLP